MHTGSKDRKPALRRLAALLLLLQGVALVPVRANGTDSCCQYIKIQAKRLPDLNIPRADHNTFFINDEILVIGGHTSGFVPTATAEYFKDGEWHVVNTVYTHDSGSAVELSSGRILIAGGFEKHLGIGQTFPAEIYDPVQHTFEGFGCLDVKRARAEGVELDHRRVVFSGNWYHDDAIECYEGEVNFHYKRAVSTPRAFPYVFRTAEDNAIVFGSIDYKGNPIDTIVVDPLVGESFRVPLLDTWRPFEVIWQNHSANCFIGDEQKGIYSYLFAAKNVDGQLGIVQVNGTEFSLLPTACAIPMKSKWGDILYQGTVVADRKQGRAYLVGRDADRRLYVLCISYNNKVNNINKVEKGQGAPLTLYYTDPLPEVDCLSTVPVLTADGNLVLVGGFGNHGNNFSPTGGAVELCLVEAASLSSGQSVPVWLGFLLLSIVVALLGWVAFCYLKNRRRKLQPAAVQLPGGETSALSPERQTEELMERIQQILSQQQLYLRSDLKVSDIADALGVNRRSVSESIASSRQCSFARYVNGFRVDYAKELLRNHPEKKISTVSLESGFANEMTFFRAFKSITGMTPTEWKQQND